MKYRSVFDIIGPVMIGPSSSHTAGAARIGRLARLLFGKEPKRADVHFYGSFAQTYRGHGTDVAIVGGLLDYDTYDERLPKSKEIAKEKGVRIYFHEEDLVTEHPNTVQLKLQEQEETMEITGVSIGGGKIEITELNGFQLKLSGHYPALFVVHHDRQGTIAHVANTLAAQGVNIGQMEMSRKEKGQEALMVIETDEVVEDEVLNELEAFDHILQVARIYE
ncbi:L-serine ammonia-lyase, iron-sulfur-dependent subunit beta [Salsuginibacillus kocurii]|uniref:L-serine ammonia-lyase, iron-sulfur-dependent subunit beta n=1 Tax=Salsuginibacillus kocurii TaxID=427078 RepID=UPI000370A34B|nr:L-serine ammonia-lyase, iron-sulfur-dependent subunit beta [Salsuginibacillus kocurii]